MLLLPDDATDDIILELGRSDDPVGAMATDRPCALYTHHGGSRPSMTQGHHVYPVYLQNKRYGKIQDGTLIFLCGTCHDNVHAWLYFMMGDRKKPNPEPPPRAKALAQKAWNWYHATAWTHD